MHVSKHRHHNVSVLHRSFPWDGDCSGRKAWKAFTKIQSTERGSVKGCREICKRKALMCMYPKPERRINQSDGCHGAPSRATSPQRYIETSKITKRAPLAFPDGHSSDLFKTPNRPHCVSGWVLLPPLLPTASSSSPPGAPATPRSPPGPPLSSAEPPTAAARRGRPRRPRPHLQPRGRPEGGLVAGTRRWGHAPSRAAAGGEAAAAMADGYHLWGPRSPLDESLWWLRGAAPPPPAASAHPFRGGGPQLVAALAGLRGRVAAVSRPQAVRLMGLDAVFGRLVTAQPPRWSGSLRVSEHSAFCRVVGRRQRPPGGLREAQAHLVATMCRQILRAILLLYTAYKKCAFVLEHSR